MRKRGPVLPNECRRCDFLNKMDGVESYACEVCHVTIERDAEAEKKISAIPQRRNYDPFV